MASEGRLREYFHSIAKISEDKLVEILMDGFDNTDHSDLKNYLDAEEGQLTKTQMDKEEGEWLDRQRI